MPIQNTNILLANSIEQEPDQYILVRGGVFHYIQITDNERELFNSDGPLESKPNLVFYTEDAETKVMLDYSGASDKDKTYLQILFKNLNNLSGLSFSNASYLDETKNIDKTFTLDLYFREFKDNILFAKTTTSINSTDLQKVFLGDYFISSPILTPSSASWSDINAIKNSLVVGVNPNTKNSLSDYYFQEGDLIEIINLNSQNNNKKFEVLEFTTINNKEVLKLKSKATNESLLGSPTLINVYTKAKNKTRASSLNKTTIGCCYNLTEKKYINNTTEYECDVRSNSLFQFSPGICTAIPDPIILSTITVNSQIIETTKLEYTLFDSTLQEDLYISFDGENKIMINGKVVDVILVETGKIYKIIQNDSTNLGLPIRITKTPNTTDRKDIQYYYDSVFGTTNPEGIGSELYLKITEDTIDTLYLLTENDLSVSSVVLIKA